MATNSQQINQSKAWRARVHEIIYEAETFEGKLFDVVLLVMILLSIIAVSWESLADNSPATQRVLSVVEWIITIFFTVEYVLRLIVVERPSKYATSFFGVIDLLSILPSYLGLFMAGTSGLVSLRALRLLRIFRIFKMAAYISEGNIILKSLRASLPKILVFVYFVLVMVCVFGTIMYVIEGSSNEGFDSIPRSMYWAIVTITTVGYGDISPITPLGQFLSAILMITGYAVIAVPTGIVSSEITREMRGKDEGVVSTQSCRYCSREGHEVDAVYCKYCGENLDGDG